MKKFYQIAIDGPAGSGKSTVAKLIAKKLRFFYIDSGAMYRAVTLFIIENNLLNISNAKLKKIKIDFLKKDKQELIFLNKKDVSRKIRSSKVNKLVSKVSAEKLIRQEMVTRQRQLALHYHIVMDGRDIGTVVFPNASLKIYLTASNHIRARRRFKELGKLKEKVHLTEVARQILLRDDYDSRRASSPLCKAQDAVVIDSSNLTVDEVLDKVNIFLPII